MVSCAVCVCVMFVIQWHCMRYELHISHTSSPVSHHHVSYTIPYHTIKSSYLARLSGSTAEFLSIWGIMFIGQSPFIMAPAPAPADGGSKGGEDELTLTLTFQPALPAWLFYDVDSAMSSPPIGKDHVVSFTFLSTTNVTYHNPHLYDTWNATISMIEVVSFQGDRWQRVLESSSAHTHKHEHEHQSEYITSDGTIVGLVANLIRQQKIARIDVHY